MEEFLKTVVAAVVLWVIALEVRLQRTQNKLNTSEQKERNEKIAENTRVLSDGELNALLSKDLGDGNAKH